MMRVAAMSLSAATMILSPFVSLRSSSRRTGIILRLNRLMLDQSELATVDSELILARDDRRAKHVREHIWRQRKTDTLRIGVVNGGICDACSARVAADGGLILQTNCTVRAALDVTAERGSLDVILALPAPLRLKRILPVASSLGVDNLYRTRALKDSVARDISCPCRWLVGTQRVNRAFFGSSLLSDLTRRKKFDVGMTKPVDPPHGSLLRELLVEGAEQSGTQSAPNGTTRMLSSVGFTAIPKVALVSSLSTALFAVDRFYTKDRHVLRCAAHPDRGAIRY